MNLDVTSKLLATRKHGRELSNHTVTLTEGMDMVSGIEPEDSYVAKRQRVAEKQTDSLLTSMLTPSPAPTPTTNSLEQLTDPTYGACPSTPGNNNEDGNAGGSATLSKDPEEENGADSVRARGLSNDSQNPSLVEGVEVRHYLESDVAIGDGLGDRNSDGAMNNLGKERGLVDTSFPTQSAENAHRVERTERCRFRRAEWRITQQSHAVCPKDDIARNFYIPLEAGF